MRMLWMAMFLTLALGGRALADIVTMNDGRIFEGEVLEETADEVKIRTPKGVVTFKKTEVRSVEYKDSPMQLVKAKRATLAEDNAKGRWELVDVCLKNGLDKEAEQLLNEIRGMASPLYTDATRKLAELITTKDPKGAVSLLDELQERTKDGSALLKSLELKRTLDEKRTKIYEDALKAAEKQQWDDAISSLRLAYQLSYPRKQSASAKYSEEDILSKLAEIRAQAEKIARTPKTVTPTGSKTPPKSIVCPKCPNGSGWRTCWRCNGKGQWEEVGPPVFTPQGMRPGQKVTVTCNVCMNTKMARCPDCSGSGVATNSIESHAGYVIRLVADGAWSRKNDDPMAAMKDAAETARKGNFALPEDFKPSYALSKEMRDKLAGVPVEAGFDKSANFKPFMDLWRKAPQQDRANFLCSYGLEAVKNQSTTPDAAPPKGEEPAPSAKVDLAALRLSAPSESATKVSALVDDFSGKWVWVAGVFQGSDTSLSSKERLTFQLKCDLAHNLHPFVYLPPAKDAHTTLSKESGSAAFLKILVAQYAYDDLSAQANALQPGDQLRMLGRVIYRKERDPEASLEIWKIETNADAATLKLLDQVNKPVTFRFEDTQLNEALGMLSMLTGVQLKLEDPKLGDQTIKAHAAAQPLALALKALLDDAKLTWVFDTPGPGLRIVAEPKPDDKKKVDAVLRFLK